MRLGALACALLVATAVAGPLPAPWLTDADVWGMMASPRIPPPECHPLTPAQVKAIRALWANTPREEKRAVLWAMRVAYVRGPYNRSRLSDAELTRLMARGLPRRERNAVGRFLRRLSVGDRRLVKRMLLNCTVRTA